MRQTPRSRIRGQNSANKEFLEIVGNGNPTGSVLKETIAVSGTISISVQKLHHQIRLRILSCSRMSENHREPEVPEEEVPVEECLDGLVTKVRCYAENFKTIGLRISGSGVAEVFIDFTEELKHTKTNPMCSFHKSRRTSC